MFCGNCGKQIIETSKFCPECGSPVNQQSGYQQVEKPSSIKKPAELILTLKPVFIGWPVIVQTIPFQIFFTIWGAGFLGGFSMFGLNTLMHFLGLQSNVFTWQPFAFWGVFCFISIPFGAYIGTKLNYNYAVYRFFNSKLEYSESFLTKEIKSINYSRVLEVTLSKGIIQQQFGLGTIVLSTAATTTSMRGSGIRIPDIQNPDEIFHKVKQLVEQNQ
jgi:membrane protein YdbS with pleckstrin-like domain